VGYSDEGGLPGDRKPLPIVGQTGVIWNTIKETNMNFEAGNKIKNR